MVGSEDFDGFREIKDLPTGDQRRSHSVGIIETMESIETNEFIVWVDCGEEEVGHTRFKKGTDPAEIEKWLDTVVEEHKKNCPPIEGE